MIIQCKQCHTKFRLDDSKVTEKGVKVRCARCKHLFTVTREQSETKPVDSGVSLVQAPSVMQEEAFSPPPVQQLDTQEPTVDSWVNNIEEESVDSVIHAENPFETTISEPPSSPAENVEFTITPLERDKGFDLKQDEAPSKHEEFDFDTLNFDGTDTLAEPDVIEAAAAAPKAVLLSKNSGNEQFSHGDINFGDEPASVPVPHEVPQEVKQEIMQEEEEEQEQEQEQEQQQQQEEELPPLPIASRRKQSPIFSGVIAVIALLAVGVLGYFGFRTFLNDKAEVAEPIGKITLRAVKASYLKNASAGQLLAISGEALNQYTTPRTALQVKGVVFDAKGQILAGKSAFAGNILTDEQLATFTLDKIEAQMANQFGASVANLDVAPGKAVPFMIVIASPPREGKDFGVEPTGSTASSGKKK